jgi:hypothetical protein
VENGTHEKLLSEKGVYARLWKAQQELEQYVDGENVDRAVPASGAGHCMTNGKEGV